MKIEKEKLEWLGDIPEEKNVSSSLNLQARFDFDGIIIDDLFEQEKVC